MDVDVDVYVCAIGFAVVAGALAGVMWAKILLQKGQHVDYFQFVRYGVMVMTPVTLLSLLTLYGVTVNS